MKKMLLVPICMFLFSSLCFSQTCDCDIFPIKKECKEKCGLKILQTGTKDQIKDSFHVTEETAKKIVSVPKRKNKTSIADFQEDLHSNITKTWIAISLFF